MVDPISGAILLFRPDLGLYLPCGIGTLLLLSAAFGRPVWLWLSFFSSWSG